MNSVESPLDRIALSPQLVHVWMVPLAHCHDQTLLARYEAMLSPDERSRSERFVFARDRHCHLVSRALVRTVLGRCVSEDPSALRFGASAQGKPYLIGHDLSFNLSHTQGMVALGVTISQRLGIDVESNGRPVSMSVATRYFSQRESQALLACPPDQRADRFCALWSLKESYVKATGQGLSAPLDDFSFALDRTGEIGLRGEPGWADHADHWWLAQWRPSPDHIASLCIAIDSGRPGPSLRFHEAVPLAREQTLEPVLDRVSAPPRHQNR